jgi:hypothetical protein
VKTAGSGDAAQGPALTPHANDPVASSAAYGGRTPERSDSPGTGSSIATMHTNNPPKRSRSPGYDAKIAKTICLRLVNRESLGPSVRTPGCRPKPRYAAGSLAIKNFAAGTLWPRACQVEDFADERLVLPRSGNPPSTPRGSTKIPSRIASPSTNGPRMSTPEPRAATGRVTSSFVNAHGRCSFSMSANGA